MEIAGGGREEETCGGPYAARGSAPPSVPGAATVEGSWHRWPSRTMLPSVVAGARKNRTAPCARFLAPCCSLLQFLTSKAPPLPKLHPHASNRKLNAGEVDSIVFSICRPLRELEKHRHSAARACVRGAPQGHQAWRSAVGARERWAASEGGAAGGRGCRRGAWCRRKGPPDGCAPPEEGGDGGRRNRQSKGLPEGGVAVARNDGGCGGDGREQRRSRVAREVGEGKN